MNVRNRSHTITAHVDVPAGIVPNGVLLAMGSVLGGFSLQLLDGRLRYVHNLYGTRRDVISSAVEVPAGAHELSFVFTKHRAVPGVGFVTDRRKRSRLGRNRALHADVVHVHRRRHHVRVRGRARDRDPATSPRSSATSRSARVVVDVSGEPYRDPLAEFQAIMAEQ